jgi:phenylpyruvate tautomerase PptA (4-oxalocrotonate tautomerase family)
MPVEDRDRTIARMPMIDVYAATGTFADKHRLAQDLARAVMRWEAVPEIPLFADNTAAFIHDLPAEAISTAAGRSDSVRVQVLTPAGVLDRDKQLGVVQELTEIVARAAGDSALAQRTWVLLTESPEGGWGIAGHANTQADIAAAARAALSAAG